MCVNCLAGIATVAPGGSKILGPAARGSRDALAVDVARGFCETLAQRLCALHVQVVIPLASRRTWLEVVMEGEAGGSPSIARKRVASSRSPIGHKRVYFVSPVPISRAQLRTRRRIERSDREPQQGPGFRAGTAS